MFEMTVLFGALSTILGIAFNAVFAARRLGTVLYDPRFTNDKFGIFVPCAPERARQVETLLRQAGAGEGRRAEAAGRPRRPRRPFPPCRRPPPSGRPRAPRRPAPPHSPPPAAQARP